MAKTALISIQLTKDETWSWTVYDEHGQTLGTQSRCKDEIECMENCLTWLHPTPDGDLLSTAGPRHQAVVAKRAPRKPRNKR